MSWAPASLIRRWFDPEYGARDRLIPRWIVLRGLGVIYFSALIRCCSRFAASSVRTGFCRHVISRRRCAANRPGRVWFAPTLLWISTGNRMLMAICWAGMMPRSCWSRTSGRAQRCWCASSAICHSSLPPGISPATNPTACCSRPDSSPSSSHPRDFARTGELDSAVAHQSVPAAVGMVPHLLRIGRHQAGERRSRVAELHRHG